MTLPGNVYIEIIPSNKIVVEGDLTFKNTNYVTVNLQSNEAAEFVVTDTFHGTIFSSRMHKQFITVIRDTNKQKLKDLLERINMEERSYSKGEMLQTKIEQEISFIS